MAASTRCSVSGATVGPAVPVEPVGKVAVAAGGAMEALAATAVSAVRQALVVPVFRAQAFGFATLVRSLAATVVRQEVPARVVLPDQMAWRVPMVSPGWTAMPEMVATVAMAPMA